MELQSFIGTQLTNETGNSDLSNLIVPNDLVRLLSAHTTLRVGGVAEALAVPRDVAEISTLISVCRKNKIKWRLLGRGSNVFAACDELHGLTIKTTRLRSRDIQIDGECVLAGAGVPLQVLLSTCAKQGLGGIEYLQSVPGNVGGAIFMNAGRGRQFNESIGNHVLSVEVFNGGRVERISSKDCRFDYRWSLFHDRPEWVITGVALRLKKEDPKAVMGKLQARMQYSLEFQDLREANAGSVYKEGLRLGEALMGASRGNAQFSAKVCNWINAKAGATWREVEALLSYAKQQHLARGLSSPTLEWILWR